MSHSDFYDALSRLIANEPIRIIKGYKINKDTVAREAGRKRGAIKASRASHAALIKSIAAASNDADADNLDGARLLATARAKCQEYKGLYQGYDDRTWCVSW